MVSAPKLCGESGEGLAGPRSAKVVYVVACGNAGEQCTGREQQWSGGGTHQLTRELLLMRFARRAPGAVVHRVVSVERPPQDPCAVLEKEAWCDRRM